MNCRTPICCLIAVGLPAAFAQAPKKISRAEATALVIAKVPPEYPQIAKQLKMEGPVELDVTLGEDGSVAQVTIVSGNPVLTRAGADAVKRWKFAPYKEDGKPVKAVAPLVLSFKLGGA
jgi:protein TonB